MCNIRNEQNIQCSYKRKNQVTASKRWLCKQHAEITYFCQEKNENNIQCVFKIAEKVATKKRWFCEKHQPTWINKLNKSQSIAQHLRKKFTKNISSAKGKKIDWNALQNDFNNDLKELQVKFKTGEIATYINELANNLQANDWAKKSSAYRQSLLKFEIESNQNIYIVDTETNSQNDWVNYEYNKKGEIIQEIDDNKIGLWAFAKCRMFGNIENKVELYNYNDYLKHITNLKINENWWFINLKFDMEYFLIPFRDELDYHCFSISSQAYRDFEQENTLIREHNNTLSNFKGNPDMLEKLGIGKENQKFKKLLKIEDVMPNGSWYTFCNDTRKVIKVVIKLKNGKKLIIEDGFLKCPKSVADMGNDLQKIMSLKGDTSLEKYGKGELDYKIYREKDHLFTNDEISYIQRDVIIPKMIFEMFTITLRERFGVKFNWELTIGSTAMKLLKSQHFFGKERFNELFYDKITSEKEYETLLRAYNGGVTQATPHSLITNWKNVYHQDIVSAYGHIMAHFKLPYDQAVECKLGENEICQEHFSIYIYVGLECRLKPNKVPVFKIKWEGNTKIYAPPTKNSFDNSNNHFSTPDLALLKNNYEIKKGTLKRIYCYKHKVHPELKKWVDYWLKMKSEGKLTGNEVLTALSKLFMLTPYGKFAEKVHDTHHSLNENFDLESEQQNINDYKYFPMGVAITSYARIILFSLINIVGYKNFLYCDTDSAISKIKLPDDLVIKLIGAYDDNYQVFTNKKELGKWEREPDAIKFKVIGPKKYLKTYQKDGKIIDKVVCAGLRPTATHLVNYDNFWPNIVFKDVNNKTKRTHTNKYTVFNTVDYTINNVSRSVVLYMILHYKTLPRTWTSELPKLIYHYFNKSDELLEMLKQKRYNELYQRLLSVKANKVSYIKTDNQDVFDIPYNYEFTEGGLC